MRSVCCALLVSLGTMLAGATKADARVLGGGPGETDCFATFEGVDATDGGTAVTCADGDPACDRDGARDGACTFGVQTCFAQTDVAGCTPEAVEQVKVQKKLLRVKGPVVSALEVPATPINEAACGTAAIIRLPLRGKASTKPSKTFKVKVKAKTGTRGKLGRDVDKLKLRCVPNQGSGQCPENTLGGPSEVRLTVAESGADLDNGWTGAAHNFAFVSNSTVQMCLSDCDDATDPSCTGVGDTGAGTVNGATFGPPLPTLVGGVATCLVSRFDGSVTGTTNVQTGETDFDMALRTEVWTAASSVVCPQCSGRAVGDTGVCESGPDRGRSCRVEGTIPVRDGNTELFRLSSSCRPDGARVATLDLRIRASTGTRSLPGPLPCDGQLRDDNCGAGTCSAECTGRACVTMQPDPTDGSRMVCVDEKGGLSQRCCSNETSLPCFETRDGGIIERTGSATAPGPGWPDPTYPKTSDLVLVDTFCEPGTGVLVLDANTTGLPGPAAAVIPAHACWTRDQSCP